MQKVVALPELEALGVCQHKIYRTVLGPNGKRLVGASRRHHEAVAQGSAVGVAGRKRGGVGGWGRGGDKSDAMQVVPAALWHG